MAPPGRPQLSDRQMQILRLRAEGYTGPEIAARLVIALGTLDYHERVIRHQLRARNPAHAVHLAHNAGLLRRDRHGNHAGFAAHVRAKEEPCDRCLAAERAYQADRRAVRRAAKRAA
ncbi:helix-turn-helix transcriptional regulator [Streptomyces sp. NPDC002994]|uniref:response regulator transcription factor n=1 Tax=Streptomyces sp. NPDC002994 TaxID=3154441 RepID=UPI00339FB723